VGEIYLAACESYGFTRTLCVLILLMFCARAGDISLKRSMKELLVFALNLVCRIFMVREIGRTSSTAHL
jgi:putative exporter of polyketide antibiotics